MLPEVERENKLNGFLHVQPVKQQLNDFLSFGSVLVYFVYLFPPPSPRSPSQPFQAIVPTLSAVFVDENLPDGTHLQPGTKFIKHWRMKNTGNVEWSSDTKVSCLCYCFYTLKQFWKIIFVCIGNLNSLSEPVQDFIWPVNSQAGNSGAISCLGTLYSCRLQEESNQD